MNKPVILCIFHLISYVSALYLHIKELNWGSNWKAFNLCRAVMHKSKPGSVCIHPPSPNPSKFIPSSTDPPPLTICIGKTPLPIDAFYIGKGRKIWAYCSYSPDKGSSFCALCFNLACKLSTKLFCFELLSRQPQLVFGVSFRFVAFRSDFDLGNPSWIAK